MDPRANRFLENFSSDGRERLVACLIYEDHPDGACLFREGDPADEIYLVLEGQVEIVMAAGHHEQIIGSFHAGEFFGEVGVLDGCGRGAGARAKGAVSIAKVPREPLIEVLAAEPVAVTLGLFQNVLAHLRRSNDLFVREVVHKEKLSLVGEMAGSLMHDLRNPIAGIRLAADLVAMNHADEETVHCCDKIRLQCDRLTGMAAELLEFSKGEATLHLGATDTIAFLQRFNTLNEDYFRQTGIEFRLNSAPAEIEIDAMRLLRLLQNLVTNAVEAIGSKPGGLIEIGAWVENSMFCLSVSDNGSGIPETVRDRIFEPFVTHGKKNGTGLGMAIARNVVTAHGGTITFETEAGQGTTFLAQLPQKSVPTDAAASA